jgi:carbonic anhydrase
MMTAREALLRLQEGNARFVAGDVDPEAQRQSARREELLDGQDPFAIVVGCADSRVPVEFVFDQGLGDLFVIRVAGNVVSQTQLASIEFAAQEYDAKLVVVLGHTGCGAMRAALAAVRSGREPESANLRMLVEKIRPAVECAIEGGDGQGMDALADLAGRENVRRAVDVIRNDPGVIRKLVDDDGLEIVGAEYSLATGVVEFF